MNTMKILAAVADGLILIATAINDEIVSPTAEEKPAAKKAAPKKAATKKAAPVKEAEPEPEIDPLADAEEESEPEAASQFKDKGAFVKAIRKLVDNKVTDNKKIIAHLESIGVKSVNELDESQFDLTYETLKEGE